MRTLFCLVGLWALPTHAATASESIYQVEMIVFERTGPTNGEAWPKNLSLVYPERWQRLFDPAQEAERQRTAVAQTESLKLSDDFLQTLAHESAEHQASINPNTVNLNTEVDSIPEFFAFLPSENRSLQKTRETLDRSAALRVLFHETWRQPFTTIEKSPALILHGGHQYGAHYELQGYIYLGLSRFLHLHTNLWFTHFSPNHGQSSEHWPNLPEEPIELSNDLSEAAPKTEGVSNDKAFGEWEQEDPYAELLQAPYVISQIVTLQQKRRLRSGELHYLDHPRLGILIKILPEKP